MFLVLLCSSSAGSYFPQKAINKNLENIQLQLNYSITIISIFASQHRHRHSGSVITKHNTDDEVISPPLTLPLRISYVVPKQSFPNMKQSRGIIRICGNNRSTKVDIFHTPQDWGNCLKFHGTVDPFTAIFRKSFGYSHTLHLHTPV